MLKAAGRHANAEKLLQQGLDRLPDDDIKGRAVRLFHNPSLILEPLVLTLSRLQELDAELATVTSARLKAEVRPPQRSSSLALSR